MDQPRTNKTTTVPPLKNQEPTELHLAKIEVMEEQEFKRALALFPIVRSRDFRADQDSYRQPTSGSLHDDAVQEWHDAWDNVDKNEKNNGGKDQNDAFWEKLKLAVESKVGSTEAEKFCQGFQQAHRKLVYEVLSVDAAKKFIYASSGAQE